MFIANLLKVMKFDKLNLTCDSFGRSTYFCFLQNPSQLLVIYELIAIKVKSLVGWLEAVEKNSKHQYCVSLNISAWRIYYISGTDAPNDI